MWSMQLLLTILSVTRWLWDSIGTGFGWFLTGFQTDWMISPFFFTDFTDVKMVLRSCCGNYHQEKQDWFFCGLLHFPCIFARSNDWDAGSPVSFEQEVAHILAEQWHSLLFVARIVKMGWIPKMIWNNQTCFTSKVKHIMIKSHPLKSEAEGHL